MTWRQRVEAHYRANWGKDGDPCPLPPGPNHQLPADFGVLKYGPSASRNMWTFATCGMSQRDDAGPIELHMFSPEDSPEIVEILTATAYYHRTTANLGLGHSVNFGRPWLAGSTCDHGLISLPYLDGPKLEELMAETIPVRCLWLVPLTAAEYAFLRLNSVETLEQAFERANFNYLDPFRSSVV